MAKGAAKVANAARDGEMITAGLGVLDMTGDAATAGDVGHHYDETRREQIMQGGRLRQNFGDESTESYQTSAPSSGATRGRTYSDASTADIEYSQSPRSRSHSYNSEY